MNPNTFLHLAALERTNDALRSRDHARRAGLASRPRGEDQTRSRTARWLRLRSATLRFA